LLVAPFTGKRSEKYAVLYINVSRLALIAGAVGLYALAGNRGLDRQDSFHRIPGSFSLRRSSAAEKEWSDLGPEKAHYTLQRVVSRAGAAWNRFQRFFAPAFLEAIS